MGESTCARGMQRVAQQQVVQQPTRRLEAQLHDIPATGPRGVVLRGWIVAELVRRHQRRAQSTPTGRILHHLRTHQRYNTRARRLQANAYAEVLMERHPEAVAAEQQWACEAWSPGADLEVYTRGPAPYVLAVLQHTHG